MRNINNISHLYIKCETLTIFRIYILNYSSGLDCLLLYLKYAYIPVTNNITPAIIPYFFFTIEPHC